VSVGLPPATDSSQWVSNKTELTQILHDLRLYRQKYSHYLPIEDEPSREATLDLSPRASVSRKAKETKAGRASAESLAQKRRSTMNSRDAAYDEAEQLRRAIEESKREGGAPSLGNSSGANKRSRSESEE
jgi:hypothetical protein